MTNWEYAYYNTLLSNTVADLKAGLNIFQEEAYKLGLIVSSEKTKLMHDGDGAELPSTATESTNINFVDSFNYLRSLISSTDNLSSEVNRCCSLATSILQLFWKPLWRQNSINCQRQPHISNASVLSVLLYDSKT